MVTSKIAALLTLVMLLAGCGLDMAMPVTGSLDPADASQAGGRDATDSGVDVDTTDDSDAMTDGAATRTKDHGGRAADSGTTRRTAADSSTADSSTTDGMSHQPGTSSGDMIVPDVSDGLPQGHPGSGKRLISSRPRIDRNNSISVFRTRCEFSHMSFDDPIVHPGQSGASHLHAYFGNTGIDANSTAGSIVESGNSTCRGGVLNRTGYWVPALVDVKTRKPVAPRFASVYYREGFGGVDRASIRPMPDGLRMIAGNAASTGNGRDNPETEWMCKTKQGPEGQRLSHIPSTCEPGKILRMIVTFPQCWDGRNLDSSDHKRHMAYANKGCPASHPVPLPQVVLYANYEIKERAPEGWRLVSDMYDRSLPGGRSAHADWFNGWDRGTLKTWLDQCYTQPKNCKDGNLNNGTGLDRP